MRSIPTFIATMVRCPKIVQYLNGARDFSRLVSEILFCLTHVVGKSGEKLEFSSSPIRQVEFSERMPAHLAI
jgi:hypothetical protein